MLPFRMVYSRSYLFDVIVEKSLIYDKVSPLSLLATVFLIMTLMVAFFPFTFLSQVMLTSFTLSS